jgi:hypothetical protein
VIIIPRPRGCGRERGADEVNTSTAISGKRSAIGNLLDMLIKHGTLPNMPRPEIITNAQVELAGLEMQIDILQQRVRELEAALQAKEPQA